MVKKSVYDLAMEDKQTASQILLPLIEFEFGFLGDDSPALIQSPNNKDQFMTIFNICKKHNWLRTDSYKRRGPNLFFRISRGGFIEIYKNAGPFSNERKKEWARVLLRPLPFCLGYHLFRDLFLPTLAIPIRAQANSSMAVGSDMAFVLIDSPARSFLLVSADSDSDILEISLT